MPRQSAAGTVDCSLTSEHSRMPSGARSYLSASSRCFFLAELSALSYEDMLDLVGDPAMANLDNGAMSGVLRSPAEKYSHETSSTLAEFPRVFPCQLFFLFCQSNGKEFNFNHTHAGLSTALALFGSIVCIHHRPIAESMRLV